MQGPHGQRPLEPDGEYRSHALHGGIRVMDIMLSAEGAMLAAAERGGDSVCCGQAVQETMSAVRG